jgi:1-deoxy-D-xylulose-5-phosphate synthase
MSQHNYKAEVKIMGIPDRLVEHGTPKQLYDEIGIDANGIAGALRDMVKDKVRVIATFQ